MVLYCIMGDFYPVIGLFWVLEMDLCMLREFLGYKKLVHSVLGCSLDSNVIVCVDPSSGEFQ